MKDSIAKKSELFVKQLLTDGLSKDHAYHNLPHTESVVSAVESLAQLSGINENELELLQIAAWFHDTGFTKGYEQHEERSKTIAVEFLNAQNFPQEKTEKILALINATKPSQQPENFFEELIKDADLNNVGQPNYQDTLASLRHEWSFFLKKDFSEQTWLEDNIAFLENHRFYTPAARALFGAQKQTNVKWVKKQLKKQKKKNDTFVPIEDSRIAQMMFKTALRNHIDLTSIADSKANIMLSINSLIITLSLPLLASNLKENWFLLLPGSLLLLTSVVTIIFATLATRPIKTTGLTDLAKIPQGKSNLFFFGNFYRMSLPDYKKGLQAVMSDDALLDDNVITDLYYLGRALGTKFNRLRICYSIFMVGITVTVISFVYAFLWMR